MTNDVRKSKENPEIREFILRHIEHFPADIGSRVANKFGVTRTTVSNYIKKLKLEGLILVKGNTRARTYDLATIAKISETFEIKKNTEEGEIWRTRILPKIKAVSENVLDICQYGFTEIFNNVIDHSQTQTASIIFKQTYAKIKITISDNGIGIFQKIKNDFNLADTREALLELSKGKLTSDKTRHSGEGIFFASRMFERFYILSQDLGYQKMRKPNDDGWLIERPDYVSGTAVHMEIPTDAKWKSLDIFEEYQDDEAKFTKTHVPLLLAKYGNEKLVSRSQAKRVLARFEKFSEIILDFEGIEEIGQAFADEIFRVFYLQHPGIILVAANTSKKVEQMIAHVKGNEI